MVVSNRLAIQASLENFGGGEDIDTYCGRGGKRNNRMIQDSYMHVCLCVGVNGIVDIVSKYQLIQHGQFPSQDHSFLRYKQYLGIHFHAELDNSMHSSRVG